MRFMMLMTPRGYEKAAPGAMPDAEAVAEEMADFPPDVKEAAAGFEDMLRKAGKP